MTEKLGVLLPSHKIQKTLCGFLGKSATRRRTYEK